MQFQEGAEIGHKPCPWLASRLHFDTSLSVGVILMLPSPALYLHKLLTKSKLSMVQIKLQSRIRWPAVLTLDKPQAPPVLTLQSQEA